MKFDFTALKSGMFGGMNALLKIINDNFADIENKALIEVVASDLPVGGAELGGVKNGGNVTINNDGTMTAPSADGGTTLSKVAFTEGDIRWAGPVAGLYVLDLANAGMQFLQVFMEVSQSDVIVPVCDIRQTATTTTITAMAKFAGYIIQADMSA